MLFLALSVAVEVLNNGLHRHLSGMIEEKVILPWGNGIDQAASADLPCAVFYSVPGKTFWDHITHRALDWFPMKMLIVYIQRLILTCLWKGLTTSSLLSTFWNVSLIQIHSASPEHFWFEKNYSCIVLNIKKHPLMLAVCLFTCLLAAFGFCTIYDLLESVLLPSVILTKWLEQKHIQLLWVWCTTCKGMNSSSNTSICLGVERNQSTSFGWSWQ